jgi:arsenate reductase
LQQGVRVVGRDFFKEPLTADELQQLLGGRSATELFSWKSRRAKALGLQPGQASEDELIQLMLSEPFLIRRPLIVIDGELVIGFDQKRLKQVLD